MYENPFYYPGPIRDPDHFYCRETQVGQILELLARRQSVAVVGPRKIGKTSLLFHLCWQEILCQHGLDPATHCLVYFNCEGLEDLKYEMFLALILQEIARSVGQVEPGFGVPEGPISFPDFREALRAIPKSGSMARVALLLDEFDILGSNPALSSRLLPGLRALAQEFLLVYIVVSHRGEWASSNDSLPFFNVLVPLRLGLFDESQSRALIKESLARAGAAFPSRVTDLVIQWGGRHPFFTQVVGYWALSLQHTKGSPLQSEDFEILRQSVRTQVEPHFDYYWKHLDPEDQYVLAALPIAQTQAANQQQLARLESECLIAKANGRYDYFSPLLRDFVRRQEVPGILQTGPLVLVQRLRTALLHERELSLSSRQFKLLQYLMLRSNRVVSIEELDREVMARPEEAEDYEFLDDGRLKSAIRELRRSLGENAAWIVNKPGVGYMLQIERQE